MPSSPHQHAIEPLGGATDEASPGAVESVIRSVARRVDRRSDRVRDPKSAAQRLIDEGGLPVDPLDERGTLGRSGG